MIYTYWGNKDEKTNGTSVLEIASGFVNVGKSGDFTTAEYNYFSQEYDLRLGNLTWTRTDFPWQTEDGIIHTFNPGGGGANTTPGAPTGVTGTAGNTSVLVSWTAPTDNGGHTITEYIVTPLIGGSAQTPIHTSSAATNYNVTGLTNGTAYTFQVAAVNSVGTGPNSSPSSPYTPTGPTMPTVASVSNVVTYPVDTTAAILFPDEILAGDCLVVIFGASNYNATAPQPASGITDNVNGAWTLGDHIYDGSDGATHHVSGGIAYFPNSAHANANTLTVQMDKPAATYWPMVALAIRGSNHTIVGHAIDSADIATNPDASGLLSFPTVADTQASDFVLGWTSRYHVDNGDAFSAHTGTTLDVKYDLTNPGGEVAACHVTAGSINGNNAPSLSVASVVLPGWAVTGTLIIGHA